MAGRPSPLGSVRKTVRPEAQQPECRRRRPVEEINRKEEIAEQKDNLAEQLSQVTKNVNDVKEIVDKLVTAIEDLKKIVVAVTAASKSTDNAVTAITNAILDSREVVITNKLDDESVRQLQNKYETYSQQEEKLYEKHRVNISEMLERDKDRAILAVTVTEGRKHLVRNLCAAAGLKVVGIYIYCPI